MFSKLSFKIISLFVFIIAIYLLFIINFISKNVTEYSINVEIKNSKSELQKIVKLIQAESHTIKIFKELSLKNHKDRIKDMAKVGRKILEDYNEEIVDYGLSVEEAKKQAFKKISEITYGQNDYFYIMDENGVLLAHPDKRFKGTSLLDVQDAKGKFFAKELMEKAKKQEDSYTRYWWFRDGSEKSYEKLTYTIYYKPWNVYLTTGVYLDDIDNEIQKQKNVIVESLRELVTKIKLIKTGYIFIVDDKGKVIIHHDKRLENRYMDDIVKAAGQEPLFGKVKEAYSLSKPLSYFWNNPKDKKNYIYKKRGWVEYDSNFNWYIVASIYEEEFENEANRLNAEIYNISILAFLILSIIGFFSIKILTSPLEKLSYQAKEVQKGNLKVRSRIKQNDEIGVLAQHFNNMLDIIENDIKNLENEVENRTKELNNKLYFDDVSSLGSKFSLFEKINKESYGTAILINIDSFNSINELYGYTVGNIVIKEFGEFLKEICRKSTFEPYRLYSDIFVLYERGRFIDIYIYEEFVEILFEKIKKHHFIIKDLDNLDIDIDITLGIAFCQEQPVKKANIALNLAKKNKKNMMVYNNELDDKENILNSIYWRKKIKYAIENDRLMPFYQPIVDKEKRIIKYETLMRIVDDSGEKIKFISPVYFQEVAIKTKQYAKLSEIIIKRALKDAKNTDKQISINLSYSDIKDRKLAEVLVSILENNRDLASRVIFEILESDNIADYKLLDDFMEKFRGYGVKIAIDDFGTGYSNFTHILNISPDYIKIDGSLIKDICIDKHSYEVVKSIIFFSKEIGIKVIAEYVHSKEVFELLLSMGVDEFQGFYFGKPESNFVTSNPLANQVDIPPSS